MYTRYPWPMRVVVALFAALTLAGVDLIVKAWAESTLTGAPDAGRLLDLNLGFNPGVAFSLGTRLSGTTLVALTGLLALALMAALAVSLRSRTPGIALGLVLLVGGAMGNLLDRFQDGLVTDYLHTGWWPTFNLADVLICAGAIVLLLSLLTGRPASTPLGPRQA